MFEPDLKVSTVFALIRAISSPKLLMCNEKQFEIDSNLSVLLRNQTNQVNIVVPKLISVFCSNFHWVGLNQLNIRSGSVFDDCLLSYLGTGLTGFDRFLYWVHWVWVSNHWVDWVFNIWGWFDCFGVEFASVMAYGGRERREGKVEHFWWTMVMALSMKMQNKSEWDKRVEWTNCYLLWQGVAFATSDRK